MSGFASGKTDLLAVVPGVVDAVHIPFDDLPDRTFELPDRREVIRVADTGSTAEEAVRWLLAHGRQAVLSSFEPGVEDKPLRLWSPNPLLSLALSQIEPGKALDAACGSGREAVAMACYGWNVLGVDALPDALERARRLEERYSTGPPIRWVDADLEQWDTQERFGLICSFRYLQRDLFQRFYEWLVPGGSLVVETFTTIHREANGRPRSDDHVLKPRELLLLVNGMEVVHYDEDWRGGSHTARVWARKAEA